MSYVQRQDYQRVSEAYKQSYAEAFLATLPRIYTQQSKPRPIINGLVSRKVTSGGRHGFMQIRDSLQACVGSLKGFFVVDDNPDLHGAADAVRLCGHPAIDLPSSVTARTKEAINRSGSNHYVIDQVLGCMEKYLQGEITTSQCQVVLHAIAKSFTEELLFSEGRDKEAVQFRTSCLCQSLLQMPMIFKASNPDAYVGVRIKVNPKELNSRLGLA